MRNLFKYLASGLILLLITFVSCDLIETAEQDASPVVSPDGYPLASFTTTNSSGTVTEGDTLVYTITINKPIDRSITFSAEQKSGTLTEDDYKIIPAVLAPYTKTAQLMIVFFDDGFPSAVEKTGQFEVGVFGIAEHYLLNPAQTYPMVNVKVKNYNDPTLLTVIFSWPGSADYDMVVWSDTPAYPHTEWSDQGATTANPEVDKAIWLSDPPGTYYINVMDWDGPAFNYKFTLGHPDGSVQIIEGTFDRAAKTYVEDGWTSWGGSYPSYRVLKVENNGTKFTVTKL